MKRDSSNCSYVYPAATSKAPDVLLSGLKLTTRAQFAGGNSFQHSRDKNLEDSMIGGQEEGVQVGEEEADRLRMLERLCQEYCAQLNLFGQTVRSAQLIIRNLLRLYPFS